MLKRIFPILLVLVLGLTHTTLAQQKFERESRIAIDEVPLKAQNFIKSLTSHKVKWYLEERINDYSIEAKFKLNKKRYSIEFDTLGTLEDAEIKVSWKTLNPTIKKHIESQLKTEHKKFKVKKVQVQYVGPPNLVLQQLKNLETNSTIDTNYEVVLKCWPLSNKPPVALYEYLFDDEGAVLSKSQIIFKNASNLEY